MSHRESENVVRSETTMSVDGFESAMLVKHLFKNSAVRVTEQVSENNFSK